MNDPAMGLAHDADALRSAAQRLHDHPAYAALVPMTLAAIKDALMERVECLPERHERRSGAA